MTKVAASKERALKVFNVEFKEKQISFLSGRGLTRDPGSAHWFEPHQGH